ncbi:peptidase [Asticcacaulis sp. YBE204]|uniref:peptidase n=1 Tax=Asticcacaulis sp. YBE204 TaxID=1282363 RepID=UPI0003C3B778|nr:peptidase [Asticcacaulis sp. YBE204]ESQ79484.1 peptidase [Asticcacaulis sp. YBE204]
MRDLVLAEARSWIGTPYQHRMSLKGVGCDCLGLVRGVWRSVQGEEPWDLPPYTGDWAEIGGREVLLDGLARYLMPVAVGEAQAGDVLVFRLKPGAVAKHAAILSAGDMADPRSALIHAYWSHAVVETWLGTWWRRHVVAAFRF